MGYKKSDRCLSKAKDDEPIFVLLGRDPTSVPVVLEWIKLNFASQPEEKLREAFEHCMKMRKYPKKFTGIAYEVGTVEGFKE